VYYAGTWLSNGGPQLETTEMVEVTEDKQLVALSGSFSPVSRSQLL
jgi:hypothetical protein